MVDSNNASEKLMAPANGNGQEKSKELMGTQSWQYFTKEGRRCYSKVRNNYSDGSKSYYWNPNLDGKIRVPYNYHKLWEEFKRCQEQGQPMAVAILEGEKCADAFWAYMPEDSRIVPITFGAKGHNIHEDIMGALDEVAQVPVTFHIFPDADAIETGYKWANQLLALNNVTAKVVELPGLTGKEDFVEWVSGYEDDEKWEARLDELARLMADAKPLTRQVTKLDKTIAKMSEVLMAEVVQPNLSTPEGFLEYQFDLLRSAAEGERNETLFKVSAAIGNYLSEFNQDEIVAELTDISLGLGLGLDEIEPTIQSGLKKGMTTPRHFPDPRKMNDEALVEFAIAGGDAEDAGLLAHIYAGKLVYDHQENQWYMWNGVWWEADETKQILKTVESVRDKYIELSAQLLKMKWAATNESEVKRLDVSLSAVGKRIKELSKLYKIESVLKLAQAELPLTREWDNHPMRLAVQNGVIDLTTGELLDPNPEDYIRTVCPVDWKGINEPADRWEQFISEIAGGDEVMVEFLQRLLGYCVTGKVGEHVFPIFYGEGGRNGKGTLLETLRKVVGDGLCAIAPTGLIVNRRWGDERGTGAEPYLAGLRGKRLAWVSEPDEGVRLSVGMVKWIVGGDTITARLLHQNPITFSPTHKLILITNHKPTIPAGDEAIWHRVVLIPFEEQFVDNPEPGQHKRDKDLAEKLAQEYPGILAWLVDGCLEWREKGLNPPEKVLAATQEYREEEDLMAEFIDECLVIEPGQYEIMAHVYHAYENWAKARGIKHTFQATRFYKELASTLHRLGAAVEKGQKTTGGKTQKVYLGLRLVSDPELVARMERVVKG